MMKHLKEEGHRNKSRAGKLEILTQNLQSRATVNTGRDTRNRADGQEQEKCGSKKIKWCGKLHKKREQIGEDLRLSAAQCGACHS